MSASQDYSQPIATVDAVVLTIEDGQLKLLVHRRTNNPFKGGWALPGGFIHTDDDRDTTASIKRILEDKTGTSGYYVEQLATYSGPDRDPRGWSLSVAHLALVPFDHLGVEVGEDLRLMAVSHLPTLAFDHAQIVADAVSRLRGKGAYSSLPASFLHNTFTLAEMHKAYEIALDTRLAPSAFRRKVSDLNFLEDTGEVSQGVNRRPAKVYRLRDGVSTFNRNLA